MSKSKNLEIVKKTLANDYLVQSPVSPTELNNPRILLRRHIGDSISEDIFDLKILATDCFPDIHHIYATHSVRQGYERVTTRIIFDQYRADQIRQAEPVSSNYEFVAEFLDKPLERRLDLDERAEQHLLKALGDVVVQN
jgi:hypothetical protein